MVPDDPFAAPVPAEVPLSPAPLVQVLAQLRFPAITSLARAEFVAPFQEALRSKYPILRAEQPSLMFQASLNGEPMQFGASTTWRLHDKNDTWRISLAQDFVAIETTAYTSRADFYGRWEQVLTALHKITELSVYDRQGVRYINRLNGDDLGDLQRLVRPEVLGINSNRFAATLVHSLCESRFHKDGSNLTVRWGILPANATTDPGIAPLSEPGWILDLDMSSAGSKDFSVPAAITEATHFAERIYTFFRWATTEELLKRRGGGRR